MSRVIIDYEKFKDVLTDYLSVTLMLEVIDSMNDNDVFLADIDELLKEVEDEANE